jgi:UDP-N-acetylmuramyl pentapeptide synthase
VAWFPDVLEAAEEVLRLARPGDTVLVKASRGLRLERLVERVVAGLRERGGGEETAEEGCTCR